MPVPPPVRVFIISLPKDRARRAVLAGQLTTLGIDFTVSTAVAGDAMSAQELASCYDGGKAVRLFNRHLSKGEIGCAISHVNIYRRMVAEDIPHALVLEDDAQVLDADLAGILSRLAHVHDPRVPTVILLSHVRRYDGSNGVQLDDIRHVHEAYRAVCAHGYLLTTAAARRLAEELFPVYVVADKWEYFQRRFIAVKALVPYAIGLSPASRVSSIDGMGPRVRKVGGRPNLPYHAKRLLDRFLLRRGGRRCGRIAFQERSPSDVQ